MGSPKKGKSMMRKRVTSALVAVFCAFLTMALSTVIALAAGEGNTLTVGLSEESHVDDITANESLVVDVFKVADATYDATYDTYTYNMVGVFADLQSSLDDVMAGNGDWKTLYDSAAVLAKDATPVVKGHVIFKNGESISLPDDGLYLVIARGASQPVGSNIAVGKVNRYTFQASMVAMPTKYDRNGEMSGPIGTDPSYGEWHNEATIQLKYAFTTIPTPPTPPTPSTGDQNRLLPLYVIMAVSGTLFAVLAIGGIRKRRSEDK